MIAWILIFLFGAFASMRGLAGKAVGSVNDIVDRLKAGRTRAVEAIRGMAGVKSKDHPLVLTQTMKASARARLRGDAYPNLPENIDAWFRSLDRADLEALAGAPPKIIQKVLAGGNVPGHRPFIAKEWTGWARRLREDASTRKGPQPWGSAPAPSPRAAQGHRDPTDLISKMRAEARASFIARTGIPR